MRLLLILAIGLSTLACGVKSAKAQNGELIEGLFRTWANSQVDKERRKRAEAEARVQEAAARRAAEDRRPATTRDPYEVQLPSGFGRSPTSSGTVPTPLPRNNPGRTDPTRRASPVVTAQRRGPINVRSREAMQYAQSLVQFNADYDRLIAQLRAASRDNASVRALLPMAYEVAATCGTLFDRLEGLDSLSTIEGLHQTLDQRYRHVSFRIRSIDGLSPSCRDLVGRCDKTCSTMIKQMRLQPQFDRETLRDLLITASTYMQALIDDMDLSNIARGECRVLQHDCRLLRQRLIAASREVDDIPYDQCVMRFSDFVSHWNRFSERVYALDDSYLSRRLDRISQCADQTYDLLWMPPPSSISQVSGIAHRIEYDLKEISKSLTFFAMSELPPRDQARLIATMRELISAATDLEQRSQNSASRRELVSIFTRFDQAWCSIKPLLSEMSSIRGGLVAETERGCEQLREVFGVSASNATPVRLAELVSVGAALEGTSESLHKTLESYRRYVVPVTYQKRLSNAARSFYLHSREVHELLSRVERLSDRGHLAKLQEETEHLLADWNRLSADLADLEAHGVVGLRAAKIRRIQQDLVPMVGKIAAALVQR